MRIRQLEYFVRVCETGSISQAAVQLNVAQPALGMQLKALENELGAQLLSRTHRGTNVTAAGEVLLEEAHEILARVGDVRRKLRAMRGGEAETVSLGLTPSLATMLTGPLLEALAARTPTISVKVYEEFSHTLVRQIEAGRLDLILAYSAPLERFRWSRQILREELFFATQRGGDHDCPGPIRFDELAAIGFVMPSEQDYLRQRVEQSMRLQEKSLKISFEVESMTAMKEMIINGMASGILPLGNITREVASGAIVARPIVDPPIARHLYALANADPASRPALRILLEAIDAQLATICADSRAQSMVTATTAAR